MTHVVFYVSISYVRDCCRKTKQEVSRCYVDNDICYLECLMLEIVV